MTQEVKRKNPLSVVDKLRIKENIGQIFFFYL